MWLIPREVKFFDLLEQQSETVVRGAKLLQECLESKGSIDDSQRSSCSASSSSRRFTISGLGDFSSESAMYSPRGFSRSSK